MNDLIGNSFDRASQLRLIEHDGVTAEWLKRQLELALLSWGADETRIDSHMEAHVDF